MTGVTGAPGVTGVPDVTEDLDLAGDPDLVHAADVLARALVRFHPSFRFEERLAARLREDGSPQPRRIIPFPALPVAGGSMPFALDLAPAAVGQAMGRLPRPVLVGGAIASGVSIAGAAVVAWRIAALRHPRRDA